jgi:membrane-bound lytic murein transglycosylase B
MMSKKLLIFACVASLFCENLHAYAADNLAAKTSFPAWLKAFKQEARDNNISAATIKNTFKNARFLPQVITLDRAQPEFITPFLTYIDRRVSSSNIERGRDLIAENNALLTKIEAQYGVPKQILVAFWGVETHYGSNKGNFGLPSSLMTLAYEGRRAEFFRGQLLDAMRIADAGHNNMASMRGSWAGAMGHMQFMPSTMIKHGVDADGDGRINIWTSLPDAFASAANYLSKAGWHKDEPAAIEVKLPIAFQYSQALLNIRKPTADWTKLGVTNIDGRPLPALDNAAILLPQGYLGPAFMVFSNFDVMMDWNRSVNYALSVAYLAKQYSGDEGILGGAEAEKDALSFAQMKDLQAKLNALGFDCGEPDGFPGLKTQIAVKQYQAAQQLLQDGYAGPSLYARLMQVRN